MTTLYRNEMLTLPQPEVENLIVSVTKIYNEEDIILVPVVHTKDPEDDINLQFMQFPDGGVVVRIWDSEVYRELSVRMQPQQTIEFFARFAFIRVEPA